jgi:hypothetical protein
MDHRRVGLMVSWSLRLRKEADGVSTVLVPLVRQLEASKRSPPWILYLEDFATY